MKKIFVIPVIILLTVLITGCVNGVNQNTNKETEQQNITQPADKVQVFLFHETNRCITCITIGKFASATVEEYFQPELRDRKIEFKEINIDLPENKELAEKFKASGSALFINAIYNEEDHISEDITVWSLTKKEFQFKSYLSNKINTLLGK